MYDKLPEKPKEGEPIVITAEERVVLARNGMITKQWRGGGMSVIMTVEKKEEIHKMLEEGKK